MGPSDPALLTMSSSRFFLPSSSRGPCVDLGLSASEWKLISSLTTRATEPGALLGDGDGPRVSEKVDTACVRCRRCVFVDLLRRLVNDQATQRSSKGHRMTHQQRILDELERLLEQSQAISLEIEAEPDLQVKVDIISTRARDNSAQIEAAMSELRQLNVVSVKELIQEALASRGSGSKLLKAAGREAADLLDSAVREGSALVESATTEAEELIADAENEARDVKDSARQDAADLLDAAMDEARDVLETARDDAEAW